MNNKMKNQLGSCHFSFIAKLYEAKSNFFNAVKSFYGSIKKVLSALVLTCGFHFCKIHFTMCTFYNDSPKRLFTMCTFYYDSPKIQYTMCTYDYDSPIRGGWIIYSFICLSAGALEWQLGCFTTILQLYAPPKMRLVLALFIIFGGSFYFIII